MTSKYIIKYIDELGNLYNEVEIEKKDRVRNALIREFIAGSPYGRFNVSDVLVISKSTGEEMWIYVER